mmetsp:Transcript_7274/g.11427  ORF Transcript_7274/g.11427 Transcript_7274/m.11427 type:complete len:89 (-) Transcript_7274:338-604(-)
MSFMEKTVLWVLFPVLAVRGAYRMLFSTPQDYNSMIKDQGLSGKKHGATCRVNMDRLKQLASKNKCTVNDVATAFLSLSVKEYMQEQS